MMYGRIEAAEESLLTNSPADNILTIIRLTLTLSSSGPLLLITSPHVQ